MFLERLFLLAVAAAGAMVCLVLWRVLLRQRTEKLALQGVPAEVAGLLDVGRRSLLYFTTEQCQQCRYQQAPLLQDLASTTGITIHTVDAVQNEQLARHYGIMTVPSTIVLSADGRPVAINHGLASLQRLQQQLEIANSH